MSSDSPDSGSISEMGELGFAANIREELESQEESMEAMMMSGLAREIFVMRERAGEEGGESSEVGRQLRERLRVLERRLGVARESAEAAGAPERSIRSLSELLGRGRGGDRTSIIEDDEVLERSKDFPFDAPLQAFLDASGTKEAKGAVGKLLELTRVEPSQRWHKSLLYRYLGVHGAISRGVAAMRDGDGEVCGMVLELFRHLSRRESNKSRFRGVDVCGVMLERLRMFVGCKPVVRHTIAVLANVVSDKEVASDVYGLGVVEGVTNALERHPRDVDSVESAGLLVHRLAATVVRDEMEFAEEAMLALGTKLLPRVFRSGKVMLAGKGNARVQSVELLTTFPLQALQSCMRDSNGVEVAKACLGHLLRYAQMRHSQASAVGVEGLAHIVRKLTEEQLGEAIQPLARSPSALAQLVRARRTNPMSRRMMDPSQLSRPIDALISALLNHIDPVPVVTKLHLKPSALASSLSERKTAELTIYCSLPSVTPLIRYAAKSLQDDPSVKVAAVITESIAQAAWDPNLRREACLAGAGALLLSVCRDYADQLDIVRNALKGLWLLLFFREAAQATVNSEPREDPLVLLQPHQPDTAYDILTNVNLLHPEDDQVSRYLSGVQVHLRSIL